MTSAAAQAADRAAEPATDAAVAVAAQTKDTSMVWKSLPTLPDPVGFAGSFAGTSGGALLVAGGSNFPKGRPWLGDAKVWYDRIYVLDSPGGEWKLADQRLPHPMGYGVSVSYHDQLICVGGDDGTQERGEAFSLKWVNGEIQRSEMPALPKTLAYACGAVAGDTIYVAGGTERTGATAASGAFYAMDLAVAPDKRKWTELPSWNGPPRILAVAAALDNAFYLFSGAELSPSATSTPARHFLKDAYRYQAGQGWQKLSDLPHPVVAAPSPAAVAPGGRLLVVGGDTGEFFDRNSELRDAHPGFSDAILAFDVAANAWSVAARFPKDGGPNPQADPGAGLWPAVTTPGVVWQDLFVIPGGEARPGVRTPHVPAMVISSVHSGAGTDSR